MGKKTFSCYIRRRRQQLNYTCIHIRKTIFRKPKRNYVNDQWIFENTPPGTNDNFSRCRQHTSKKRFAFLRHHMCGVLMRYCGTDISQHHAGGRCTRATLCGMPSLCVVCRSLLIRRLGAVYLHRSTQLPGAPLTTCVPQKRR